MMHPKTASRFSGPPVPVVPNQLSKDFETGHAERGGPTMARAASVTSATRDDGRTRGHASDARKHALPGATKRIRYGDSLGVGIEAKQVAGLLVRAAATVHC